MNTYAARVRREQGGFTLIELLIVIVILAVLAGIVLFAVGGITNRGAASACKSDVKTVEVAIESYRAKNGSYPPNLAPTLTSTPDQFLRPQDGLSGNTLVQNGGAGASNPDGYTITYAPATGAVTVAPTGPNGELCYFP